MPIVSARGAASAGGFGFSAPAGGSLYGLLTPVNSAAVAGGVFANLRDRTFISPDGKHAYASGTWSSALRVGLWSINSSTKAISYVDNYSTGFNNAAGVMCISPDGNQVYQWIRSSPTRIAVFNRNSSTGALTLSTTVTAAGGNCQDMQITADGTNIYCAVNSGGGVLTFARNTSTGAITFEDARSYRLTSTNMASVTISPDGNNVYAYEFSPSSQSLLYQFSRNPSGGAITLQTTYNPPNGTSTGAQVVATNSEVYFGTVANNTIRRYSRNAGNGNLTSQETVSTLSNFSMMIVTPDGRSLYTAARNNGKINCFSRDTTTGILTPFATQEVTPIATGSFPWGIHALNDVVIVSNNSDSTLETWSRRTVD